MKVYDFESYKTFVVKRIESMPGKGRGELQKIARQLKVHTSFLSQVFRADKDLSPEHGASLGDYLGLNETEVEYFVCLIERDRAGSKRLKSIITRRLAELRKKGLQLASRLPANKALTEEQRSTFYSNWYFCAVSLLVSIPEYRTLDAISDYLKLPKSKVRQVLDFLVSTGLCNAEGNEFTVGRQRTHLPANSVLINTHHTNWRLRALQRYPQLSEEELAFSCPLSISLKDRKLVREKIAAFIEEISALVDASEPQTLACLNIDWFNI